MLFMLSFPVVFARCSALTFGGGATDVADGRLLVEDRDERLPSGLLAVGARSAEQTGGVLRRSRGRRERGPRVDRGGAASALLLVPQGFADDLLRGPADPLELCATPPRASCPRSPSRPAVLTEVLSGGDVGAARAVGSDRRDGGLGGESADRDRGRRGRRRSSGCTSRAGR